MTTKDPKIALEPRICLFCGKEFQPRKGNHRCCDSKCRARLQHNVKLDDSLRVLHCEYVGSEENPGTYAVTVQIHGFAVKGFLYLERNGYIIWPKCFLSYGAFYKQKEYKGHGLSIPSAKFQKLIRQWLDRNDPDLKRRQVEDDERQEAERERREYEAKLRQLIPGELCPACDGKVYRYLLSPQRGDPHWIVRCINCGHYIRDLNGDEVRSMTEALMNPAQPNI
jgi:hypothetical protein